MTVRADGYATERRISTAVTVLRAPWTGQTWMATTHVMVGAPIGLVTTFVLVVLGPLSAGLLVLPANRLFTWWQRARFAALGASVAGMAVPRLVTADADEADAFFADALRRGHEGIMAKAVDAPYEAGRRGFSWLKVKPAHTLDLVILAAEWGHGRRRGWLSNLHLGARGDDG